MTIDLEWTVIHAGAITAERIHVTTFPFGWSDGQVEPDKAVHAQSQSGPTPDDFLAAEIVPTVPYKVLHEEPQKPYVTVELLEDLEYGVYDLETESIIRTIALDKDEAIRVTNEFNQLQVADFVQGGFIKIPKGVDPTQLWFDREGKYVGTVSNVPIGKMTEASKTFAKVFLAVVWPAYILFALFVMIRSWY